MMRQIVLSKLTTLGRVLLAAKDRLEQRFATWTTGDGEIGEVEMAWEEFVDAERRYEAEILSHLDDHGSPADPVEKAVLLLIDASKRQELGIRKLPGGRHAFAIDGGELALPHTREVLGRILEKKLIEPRHLAAEYEAYQLTAIGKRIAGELRRLP